MTDNQALRSLIADAEKHCEIVRCGNPRHTNFAVGCPDCGAVCEWCDDEWPCLPTRLADALETALSVPDTESQDLREQISKILHPGYGNWSFAPCPLCRKAEKNAEAILAAFPVLSRDIAGEIEAEAELHGGLFETALRRAAEIVRNGR